MQAPLQLSEALTFQLFLPEGATVASSVQLKPLAGDNTAAFTPIVGIANQEATVQLPDHDICLGKGEASSGAIANMAEDMQKLQVIFSALFPLPQASQQDFGIWHGAFRAFVKGVTERRSQHVELWLNENMSTFLDDPEALSIKVSPGLLSSLPADMLSA